jgi:hypothetical protein
MALGRCLLLDDFLVGGSQFITDLADMLLITATFAIKV